jgi:hypothetical protein
MGWRPDALVNRSARFFVSASSSLATRVASMTSAGEFAIGPPLSDRGAQALAVTFVEPLPGGAPPQAPVTAVVGV